MIRRVTREEHKSTHSIRDFISRSGSVKVKCWRISPGSIIVCNFTYGPLWLNPCCCPAFTRLTEVTYEMPQEGLRVLCSFCLTELFKKNG